MTLPVRGIDLEEAVGLDSLTAAAGGYLDAYLRVDSLTGESFGAGVKAILTGSRGELAGALKQAGRSGVLLLGVALLCSLWEALPRGTGPGGLDPVRLAGAVAVTGIAVCDVNTLMGLGREVLNQMEIFSRVLLPVVTTVSALSGTPGAAVARQGAVLLFLELLISLSRVLILPLIYGCIGLSMAGTALNNKGLSKMASLLKGVAMGLLTALLTAFVFYLSVTGSVAGSADALAQKTAKTMLSGMIPVVGGILSDAAETVAAGAGALRGTVGVVGLLCVLALCLGPFLRLGCHYLIYKLSASLAEILCAGPVTSLIDAMVGAFSMLLGMVGSAGIILYVALLVSVKAVGG